MHKRKHTNPSGVNEDLLEQRVLRDLADRRAAATKLPPAPTMQERIDQQDTETLDCQPRMINGLDDVRELRRLADAKDISQMKAFLKSKAREAADRQLTYWKEFFRAQRQSAGRPPELWIEEAARMWRLGNSWEDIAVWRRSNGDLGATKDKVRKAVKDYCRRLPRGIPLTD